ncbi:alpha/beta hydrolase family protein [Williamsia sp. CHRR-6]|uniref:alpha/beta hydrolase n=1 Tax=Williamsia sp. CHRR-6 TaxID=2835871 RepID=UPI002023D066|nr:alpha/beta hydrolase family protein [Williamsia sp. CHRR-6]
MRIRLHTRRAVIAASSIAAIASIALVPTTVATAAPALPSVGVKSSDGSSLESVSAVSGQELNITVRSAAMDKVIPLTVLLPADRSKPRPTLYLLNGAGGGEDSATWQRNTDIVSFFAKKNVNVVVPNSGAWTYYTDWIKDDKVLGKVKWSTFLGKELPEIIDKALGASGSNAIAGISSSATSVFNLAMDNPGRFKAVGSYSGCVASSAFDGQTYIKLVVNGRGGADPTNMWGPYDGPLWKANDAIVSAAKLRGLSIYVSNGSGLPGPYDSPDKVRFGTTFGEQILLGGPIEAATNFCAHRLQSRLAELKIPAKFHFPPVGTHSWNYWEDELHLSWPQMGRAIGA